MKIRVTLNVSDELRRRIAQEWVQDRKNKTEKGRATRDTVVRWLDALLLQADTAAANWLAQQPPALTESERADAQDAVAYLRAAGWAEEKIVKWVLAQRALADHVRLYDRALEKYGKTAVSSPP